MFDKLVLVEGVPASGKSTSIRTLNPETTFIIDCTGKGLSWVGWDKSYVSKKNYGVTHEPDKIIKTIDTIDKNKDFAHINTLIIDDFQYSQSFTFMPEIKNKGYEKFNTVASNNFNIFMRLNKTRDDLFCVVMSHTESYTDVDGGTREKFKTIGKATDVYMDIDGLVSNIMYATKELESDGSIGYYFYSEKLGTSARALLGLWETSKIPNDLELVRKKLMGIN